MSGGPSALSRSRCRTSSCIWPDLDISRPANDIRPVVFLRWQEAGRLVILDQGVVELDVGAPACHQLRAGDGGEYGAGPLPGIPGADDPRLYKGLASQATLTSVNV